jgi:hypothetical protein
MNTETPQAIPHPTSPIPAPQINHLEELNRLRQQTDKVMKNILPIIKQLKMENAQLKAQLAEAQKKALNVPFTNFNKLPLFLTY